MKYISVVLILIVLLGLYVSIFLLNNKVKKPDNCKDLECKGCNLNCNKRGEL